jgi:4-alpha-glucanotransferase
MADAWGIEHRYLDAGGEDREVDASTIDALREVIGEPDDAMPHPVVLRQGEPVELGPGELQLEDGRRVEVGATGPGEVPLGYHRHVDPDGVERSVIVAPRACHLPDQRAWGWAVQLYATRSSSSWGVGDLGDLSRLGRWAGELGAGFLLVNPLGAVRPTQPQQPSPYFPASRRFRNPLYLRVEDVPRASQADGFEAAVAAGRSLNGSERIERDLAWRHKREVLEQTWELSRGDADFARWYDHQPESLRRYGTWAALVEQHGGSWRDWPEHLRHPDGPGVRSAAAELEDRGRYHAWLQWLVEQQLVDAGRTLPLIQDLPIGVDPDGFDAWEWQDLLADGVSVGAPPDEFNTAGQDWGLPPFVPWKLRAAGYEPFIETIRATMADDGGLRIDHVMGLFRLWWIGRDATPTDGAYVRLPAQDLLAIVALESHRANAFVVGEDLGTVEETARDSLRDHDVLSYRLLWFEEDPPEKWPTGAMAAVTTHDLPTVAGLWDGSDLATQQELGLEPNVEGTEEMRARLAERGDLEDDASAQDAVLAAHRLLSRTPSTLLVATLDDALVAPERPNIPGADDQRDNWALPLPSLVEELEQHPVGRGIAAALDRAVRAERDRP